MPNDNKKVRPWAGPKTVSDKKGHNAKNPGLVKRPGFL